MSTRDQIVVVGMGAASALGTGCAAMAAALVEGRDGIRPVDRFETAGLSSGWAGTWPAWDGRKQTPVTEGTALDAGAANFSAAALAHPALTEALAQARLDPMAEGRRMALLLGTCFGDGFTRFAALTEALADAFGIAGPRLTFCTACSSSTNAIGHARDLLNAGVVDVAVAGGVDVLLREGFAGFNALGVLSAAKCAPFGTPAGTTLGEGAGFIVLMRAQDARQRGCQVIASIDGYGLSADAHHETAPDPSGAGIERAVRAALLDAGVTGTEIDHVNAHATGTDSNDATEWAAIARALASRPPASGLKSYLAHGMGAAGVLELILALVAMRKGLLPATLRALPPRLGAPPDPVPQVRHGSIARAIDVSAGFGGANAVLVYGAPDSVRRWPTRRTRAVCVRGFGLVAGSDAAGGGFDFVAVAPTVDPRRLDPSARLLTAAVALAFKDAGGAPKGTARDRTGLFVGATRMPAESTRRCHDSIVRHGAAGTSAAAFARMSVNAPAGACCKSFGLRGPTTTVSIGRGSGLFAIAHAADWLARRDDAAALVAAAVDEADAPSDSAAVATVLARAETAMVAGDLWIAGWGLAGPGDVGSAARAALADHPRPEVVFIDGSVDGAAVDLRGIVGNAAIELCEGRGEATPSAFAFVHAVQTLRAGDARSILITANAGRSAAVAVLLRRSL